MLQQEASLQHKMEKLVCMEVRQDQLQLGEEEVRRLDKHLVGPNYIWRCKKGTPLTSR